MSSIELYDKIYHDNIDKIRSGNIEVDSYLASGTYAPRRGVSLIISIKHILDSYQALVARIGNIEPDQYYYPIEDLHVTIFDFIKGTKDYERNDSLEESFLNISRQALEFFDSFCIEFKGVVFSPGAGIIKGFDEDILIGMRKRIRQLLIDSKLKNDERYESQSAHITFTRFKSRIHNPSNFYKTIEADKEFYLGKEKVGIVELVEHDWYNSFDTKRVIGTIDFT